LGEAGKVPVFDVFLLLASFSKTYLVGFPVIFRVSLSLEKFDRRISRGKQQFFGPVFADGDFGFALSAIELFSVWIFNFFTLGLYFSRSSPHIRAL
jgi:hypothetical protein